MARCPVGKALCGAVDEIRESVSMWAAFGYQQVRQGRPQKQLDHIRRTLEEHDTGCWKCREGADPGDENRNQGNA